MPNKIIMINGRPYDALTGLPVVKNEAAKEAPKAEAKPVVTRAASNSATAVHTQTQRSQTLRRRSTKKPVAAQPLKRPATGRHMDIARNSKVTRFAPHPVAKPAAQAIPAPAAATAKPDRPAQVHPTAARAIARTEVKKSAAVAKPSTAKEVKNAAIAVAMATPKAPVGKNAQEKSKWPKRLLIIAGVIVFIGLIVFIVYRFIPSVSVGIASAQSGVSATYPEYVPDGYSLSHPVTYSDGEVVLNFDSNSSDSSYSISQTRSTWDSSAVLDNIVRPATGENYITTKERGLTVYSYDDKAAWVNGGVLYVVSSDNAPLSGEQVRRIATSL